MSSQISGSPAPQHENSLPVAPAEMAAESKLYFATELVYALVAVAVGILFFMTAV